MALERHSAFALYMSYSMTIILSTHVYLGILVVDVATTFGYTAKPGHKDTLGDTGN